MRMHRFYILSPGTDKYCSGNHVTASDYKGCFSFHGPFMMPGMGGTLARGEGRSGAFRHGFRAADQEQSGTGMP